MSRFGAVPVEQQVSGRFGAVPVEATPAAPVAAPESDNWDAEIAAQAARNRTAVEDQGLGELLSDSFQRFGRGARDLGIQALDWMQPDAAPSSRPGDPNLAERAAFRIYETLTGAARGTGTTLEALDADIGNLATEFLGGPVLDKGLLGYAGTALRSAGEWAQEPAQAARDAENARRIAAGLPTLEEETARQGTTVAGNLIRQVTDRGYNELLSDTGKLADKEAEAAVKAGFVPAIEYMARNPLTAASTLGAPSIPSIALALGTGGATGSARAAIASGVGLEGMSAGDQAEQAVLNAPAEQLGAEYAERVAAGEDAVQVRMELARRAGDAARGGALAMTGAAGFGGRRVTQALGLDQVEDIVARGGLAGTRGRLANAAITAPVEAITEFPEELAAAVANNAAMVDVGMADLGDVFDKEAFGQAAVGLGLGGTIGAATGAFATPAQPKPSPTAKPEPRAESNSGPTPADPVQPRPAARADTPIDDEAAADDILAALMDAGIEPPPVPEQGGNPEPAAPAAGSQPGAVVSPLAEQFTQPAPSPSAESSERAQQVQAVTGQAVPRNGVQAGAIIDRRIAELQAATQRGRLPNAPELQAELDELQAMLREQDAKLAQGINLAPADRLTPDERQTAEGRIVELRQQLEANRTATSAGYKLADLQRKLDRIDTDAGLIQLSQELSPLAPDADLARMFDLPPEAPAPAAQVQPQSSAPAAPQAPARAAAPPAPPMSASPAAVTSWMKDSLRRRGLTDKAIDRMTAERAMAEINKPWPKNAPAQPFAGADDAPLGAQFGDQPAPTAAAPAVEQTFDVDVDYTKRKPKKKSTTLKPLDATGKPRSILDWIAHGDGLDRDTFARELGIDPKELGRRAAGQPIFRARKKNDAEVPVGMTPDEFREWLQTNDYVPRDQDDRPAEFGVDDALDMFDRAFRGGQDVWSYDQLPAVQTWQAARRGEPQETEAGPGQVYDQAVTAGVPAEAIERAIMDGLDQADIERRLRALIEEVERGTVEAGDSGQVSRDDGAEQSDQGESRGGDGEAAGRAGRQSARPDAPGEAGPVDDYSDVPFQRREAASDSGIPAGLPASQTAATRTLAGRLNRYRAREAQRRGKPAPAELRFWEVDPASLPDAVRRAIAALGEATGTRVVVVRNLTPEVDRFNGVSFGDGVIYIDESADRPAVLVAAHEWLHQLKRDDPAAYQRLEDEVRRQGNMPAWIERMAAEGNKTDEDGALEELTADAVADAMIDPAFLRRVVEEGGALRRAARSFLRFLDGMLARVRGRNTAAYMSDVQAFRDELAAVLREFQPRFEAPTDADLEGRAGEFPPEVPDFLRRGQRASTDTPAFREWFKQSRVVDAAGNPLVVYHGTGEEFEAFDRGRLASATGHASSGLGFFFTPDKAGAQAYADKASDFVPANAVVLETYLSIQRPYRMTLQEAQSIEDAAEANAMRMSLQAQGYDGVHIPEQNAWVAFRANQVKRTDNLGTWNPNDDRMRFQRRGSASGDLFAQPTASEEVRAEQERRDAQRNGRTGTGRTDMMAGPGDLFAGPRPDQADIEGEQRGMFQRRLTGDVFESALLRSVEEGKGAPKRGTAEQWRGWLDGAVRRGEFKQSERDWLDVDGWLQRQGGNVTREALAEYVRANQVELEEVRLGDGGVASARRTLEQAGYRIEGSGQRARLIGPDGDDRMSRAPASVLEAFAAIVEAPQGAAALPPGWTVVENEDGDGFELLDAQGIMRGEGATREEAVEDGQDRDERVEANIDQLPKFGQYQLPGGTNYREVLLTFPDPNRDNYKPKPSGSNAMAIDFTLPPPREEYRSSHWDQPNVLAHVRMNDRTDAQGREVLFIEEIQSDWHQEGRKKGYAGRTAGRAMTDAEFEEFQQLGRDPNPTPEGDARYAELLALNESTATNAVPDAPLKATDEWAMLAFKRVVREAVERGKSVIAWTTGDQQAERYDLSKQVDRIAYAKTESGTFNIQVFRGGENVLNRFGVSDTEAEALVGKEIVQKMSDGVGDVNFSTGYRELSGLNLKVGGEGMRSFYDRILPAAVNKWAKKFGGRASNAQVRTGKFRLSQKMSGPWMLLDDDGYPFENRDYPTEAEARAALARANSAQVHALEITPAMREAASGPMPLFQRRSVPQARAEAAAKRATADSALGNPMNGGALGWNPVKGKWEGSRAAMRKAREGVQDKFIALRDLQQDIEAATGQPLDDLQNVYRLENLMHGRVQDGILDIERKFLEPLFDAMRKAGVEAAQLEEYLEARHAEERNQRIAAINPGMPDGGSGLTTAEARAILASADRAKLEPLARRIDAITADTRRRLLASGVLTQEQFDAMEGAYNFYVPLRGIDESEQMAEADRGGGIGRGIEQRSSGIKRAAGRGAGNRAKNILGEVIADAQRAVIAAEKARVDRAIARLVLANPNPNLWEIEAVRTERKFDAQGNVYQAVVNESAEPDVVHVLIKGKPYRVRIANPHVVQALKNIGANELHKLLRPLAALNRYVSATLTSYNPSFIAVNLARDATFGTVRVLAEDGPTAYAATVAGYGPAVKALAVHEAKGRGTGKMDQRLREFLGAGGKTGWVSMNAVEDLQRGVWIDTSGQLTARGLRGLRSIGRFVESANVVVENAMRLSYFNALRDKGLSVEQAAEKAKNLTVNFNRKGQWGNALSTAYLFFNPAIQGTHQVVKLAKNPKAAAAVATMTAVQVVLAMLAAGIEDEDGETLADKVPEHVKERNLWAVIPGKRDPMGKLLPGEQDRIVTLPMPFGFNAVIYAGSVGVDVATRDMAEIASGARSPIGVAASVVGRLTNAFVGATSPVPLNDGIAGMIPTIPGQIAAGLISNRDSLGRTIAQPQFDANNPEPLAYNARPETPAVFVEMAKGLNWLGGGDEVRRPLQPMDWAPEQLEYLWEWTVGGAGRFVGEIVSGSYNLLADPEALETKPAPIARAFTQPLNEGGATLGAYYDRVQAIEEQERRIRGIVKAQGIDAAIQYADSVPYMAGVVIKERSDGSVELRAGSSDLYDAYRKAQRQLKELRTEERAIYAEEGRAILNADRARRLREIRERRIEAVKDVNLYWNDAVKPLQE